MLFLFALRFTPVLGIDLSHRGTCSACNYYKSRQVGVALCWIAVVSVLLSDRCRLNATRKSTTQLGQLSHWTIVRITRNKSFLCDEKDYT